MKKILATLFLAFYTLSTYGQASEINQQEKNKPFILGEVRQIQSNVLGEIRTLNIYFPDGYSADDSTRYPVIYLLDGSADEDFIHIVGLVQYNSFEWIRRVPKSIVVGIATVDRRRDFTFPTTIEADLKAYPTSGKSENFILFLESELQPFIDKNFKTSPAKTIIGQSLGGLLATEILLTKPALFTNYIIISPSVWWDNGSLLGKSSDLMRGSLRQQTNVYIGVGKEGLTPTSIPRVMEVDANLLADKIKATKSKLIKVLFDYLPQEDHATIMHQAVSNAFRQLNEIESKK